MVVKALGRLGIKFYLVQQPHSKEVTLPDRVAEYNRLKPSLIYSIHGNANKDPAIRGCCCFYDSAHALGAKHVEHLHEAGLPLHSGSDGVHPYEAGTWTDLYLIRKTTSPVLLTENGFFTNEDDRDAMRTTTYHNKVAQVIINDILWYMANTGG